MKAVYFSLLMLCYCTSYSQIFVQSTVSENRFQSHIYPIFPEDVSQDLFFSIGPNGLPQYGQAPSWNLEENTTGTARFFKVKKGDWDRSAIQDFTELVHFDEADNPSPIENNPNVHLGSNWIKLGTSWNFSHDNYNIAIVSFTNQSDKIIDNGVIKFSHPSYPYINVEEFYIYNEWVQYAHETDEGSIQSYEFKFEQLKPGEIRHFYLKVNLSRKTSFSIPQSMFQVEMVGYQSDAIVAEGIIPPHDPNSITLLTALENTPPIYNCEDYDHVPELDEICVREQLFWVQCRQEGSPKCPSKYSLHYPYCNLDSELLTYRVNCLNDGRGAALHIGKEVTFQPKEPAFHDDFFHYESSHSADGFFDFPVARFFMKDINLPGLSNETTVYTYDECSAEVIFQVKTLCNIREKVSAQAAITFYDLSGEEVDPIETNTVYIVPEQGEYNNYDPTCISCSSHKGNATLGEDDLTLTWTHSTLNIDLQITESPTVKMTIFNTSGRVLVNKDLKDNGNNHLIEQINTSDLAAGIYFISVQNGKERMVKKFVKH